MPSWSILSSEEFETNYEITAKPNESLTTCPLCGKPTLLRYGTDAQVIHDAPSHGKKVTIRVARQRFRCTSCGKTSFESLPDVDEKRFCTKRLLRYLERSAMSRTFLSLAEEVGLHEKTVRHIFHDYVQVMKKSTQIATPRLMGIDQLYAIHQARSIITNIETRTIVEFLPDRKKQTIMPYLSHLEDRNQIEIVYIDMWQPYREAIREVLPQASIVIDKFHAVKLANDALEQIHKEVRAHLSAKQRRTLMQDRYILLKRKSELKDKDCLILETWIQNFPVLGKAYTFKERFFEIWDAESKDEAYALYLAWQSQIALEPEIVTAFAPIALTLEEWRDELFAYFDHRITNTYTGSLHSLARVVTRLGRGYSFDVLRARLLYGIGQHPIEKTKETNVKSHQEGTAISTLIEAAQLELELAEPILEAE